MKRLLSERKDRKTKKNKNKKKEAEKKMETKIKDKTGKETENERYFLFPSSLPLSSHAHHSHLFRHSPRVGDKISSASAQTSLQHSK